MKIVFITTDWVNSQERGVDKEYGGVGYYRAIKPAEYLNKAGHTVEVFGSNLGDHVKGDSLFEGYKNFVRNYNVVVIKQSDSRNIAQLIGACKETKTPVVMDIDDNFVEVFKGQPALEQGYEKGGVKKAYAMAALSMVDAVFVSTEPLKEYFSRELKKLFDVDIPFFVLPNCNDIEDWQHTTTTSDKIIIGWHGSITHDEDLKVVLPHLRYLMKRDKNIWLQLVGGIREDKIEELFGKWRDEKWVTRVQIIGGTPSWEGFPELLMSMPWNIALAPLVDNKFNESKSNIKWLETSMLKCPLVASDVAPYKAIEHGVTGFLCKNGTEWRNTLKNLLEDENKRLTVGENSYNEVVNNWQYKDNINLWEKAFEKVKGLRVV